MPNLTPNFSFNLPLVNNAVDADLWGGQLNANWTKTDTELQAVIDDTRYATSAESSDFSVVAADFNATFLIDASSNTVTATLPAASTVFDGFVVRFKATDVTNTVTIDGDGSETIDGQTTVTIDSANAVLELVCDGSNWQVIKESIASQTEAEAGTDNTKLMTPLRTDQAISARGFSGQLVHVQDQKSLGTDGGTFSSGAWRTRDLNTELTNEVTGASLSSNQITLPAGDYFIEARAPVNGVDRHQTRLQDVTNAATLLTGSSEIAVQSFNVTTPSVITGRFTLSGTADVELQHRCETSNSGNGFGEAANFTTEVYSDVLIWKVG